MENSNKPLCIMSDFHSVYQAMWKVYDKLDDGYKVAILGDCIDRGAYGYRILSEIYKECQSGSDLIFIPGNHEAELYSTLYYVYKRYERILDKREIENGDRLFTGEDKQNLYNEILEIMEKVAAYEDERGSTNGSAHTYFGILYDMEYYEDAAETFIDVMDWLGSQPLLRIETDVDGKKIALCHASFDMGLYEDFGGQFSLETRLALREKMKASSQENDFYESYYERARTCLWYRSDLEKKLVPVRLPTEEEADQIVIGHVSQPNNEIEVKTLKGMLKRKEYKRQAIDVDMGYSGKYNIHGSLRNILDKVTDDQLPAITTLVYEPSHEDEPHYEKSFWKIKEEQTQSNAPNMFNNYKCPLVKDDTSLDPDDDFEEI